MERPVPKPDGFVHPTWAVGLDLSLDSAGVVVLGDGLVQHHEALQYAPVSAEMTRTKSGKSQSLTLRQKAARLAFVCDGVCRIMLDAGTPHAVIENYAFSRGGASASVTGLAEVSGAVRVALFKMGVVPLVVEVSVARAFVCGKGNATKEDTIAVLQGAQYGKQQFGTEDEYDAMALALILYYLRNPGKREGLSMKQVLTLSRWSDRVDRVTGVVVPSKFKKVQLLAQKP
jgi:Holliday junction resolvasome RuvABC endonuclease subunit